MGKNQSASNLVNIIQYNNGNISFVNGSTTLMQISSSGAITTTGVISGSNALSASYAASASSADAFSIRGNTTIGNNSSSLLVVNSLINSNFFPAGDGTYNLGNNYGQQWNNVYANTYYGSLAGNANSATSASYATSSSYALNATNASSATSATTAATASSADNLTVRNTLTAQTLVVQTITSSVDFVTGSTRFGSLLTNTHVFSGSVTINPGGLFVSSSGLVGIGTTNPANFLHINGLNPNLIIQNTTSSVGSEAILTFRSTFGDGNIAYLGYIRAIQQSTSQNTGDIAIHAYSTGSANEVIRIKGASGNVGIGTTNPSAKLDVSGSITVSGSLSIYGDGAFINRLSSGEPYLFFRKDGVNRGSIYGVAGGGLRIFDNNDVQVFTVTSSFVGIGVTNPPTRLHVAGAAGSAVPGATGIPSLGFANSSSVALFTNLDTNYGTLFGTLNTGVGWIQQQRVDGTGTAYNLSLQPNGGNVGIGITPQGAGSAKTLEIGSRGIIYDNNDNFLYGNNGWVDSGTWKYKQSGYACILATNGGQFLFSTATSGTQNNAITWNDRFVIQNGGNVGIGTGSPSQKLQVIGDVGSSGGFRSYKGTNATVGDGSNFYLDGSGGYTIWQQTGNNKTSWFQYISGAWGEKMYLDNGSLTTTGNITVGGTLTESSSIRYKTNVETVKYGLDKVLQLRGVTYDKKDTGIRELGLIAEEVNEILPDVVIKNEEGEPDSVSYGRLTAVLIEAVKDLQAQINELKAK